MYRPWRVSDEIILKNGDDTIYLKLRDDGVTIVSGDQPVKIEAGMGDVTVASAMNVTINATTMVTINAPIMHVTGDITLAGGKTVDGDVVSTHTHGRWSYMDAPAMAANPVTGSSGAASMTTPVVRTIAIGEASAWASLTNIRGGPVAGLSTAYKVLLGEWMLDVSFRCPP